MLSALGIERPRSRGAATISPTAEGILAHVLDAPAALDDLVRAVRRDAAEVAAALVELELCGLVRESDGVYRPTSDASRSPLGV